MKTCHCGLVIPSQIVMGGITKRLKNRTQCLNCLPFGTSRYRKKTPEEERTRLAIKAKRYYDKKKLEMGAGDPISILRSARREYILKLVNSKCQFCDYAKLITNLAFHHMSDKEIHLSSREFQFSYKTILAELKKCVVCCHNCHGEIHANIISIEEVLRKHVEFLAVLPESESWSTLGITLAKLLKYEFLMYPKQDLNKFFRAGWNLANRLSGHRGKIKGQLTQNDVNIHADPVWLEFARAVYK